VVVITFRRMLKATVANGTNELWLQEELLEAGRMDTGVNVGIPEVQDKAPTQEAVSERQTDQHQRARESEGGRSAARVLLGIVLLLVGHGLVIIVVIEIVEVVVLDISHVGRVVAAGVEREREGGEQRRDGQAGGEEEDKQQEEAPVLRPRGGTSRISAL